MINCKICTRKCFIWKKFS